MKAGKLSPEQLERLVLGRFKRRRTDVLVPAGLGEDSAVIDFGAEVCVLSTDPITGAGEGAGRLAVHVSCNDIAANGATPIGVQVALLLPVGFPDNMLTRLMDDIETACRELQIEVLGGHTEITSQVVAPVIVTTAIGRAPREQYVTSAGARQGNSIVVTKGVGLEGTAILATDWSHVIRQAAVGSAWENDTEELLIRARSFAQELSAVQDGIVAAEFGVTAMHDVTEGGLYGALWELGQASRCSFRVDETLVPIRPETERICACLGLDPFGLISSGTMLITCANGPGLVHHLAQAGVQAFIIGQVGSDETSCIVGRDGKVRPLRLLAEDELWRFLAGQK